MFSLNTEDKKFKVRQSSVFDSLGDLETKHEKNVSDYADNDDHEKFKRPGTPEPKFPKMPVVEKKLIPHSRDVRDRDFRANKDASGSDFRPRYTQRPCPRPRPRGGRRQQIPKDPSKWTKYDLSDVSHDQMSDKSNAAAAFSFLEERRKMKEIDESTETNEESERISFTQRPASQSSVQDQDTGHKGVAFVDGKRRMPEYVVGSAPKKPRKASKDKKVVASGNVVNLSHLEDEDEEDS